MANVHLLFVVLLVAWEAGAQTCPEAGDILPCVCSVDHGNHVMMDCSMVESEDELATAFSANMPDTHFRKLTIDHNEHLKMLREGDLGAASFEQIWITYSALEEVQAGALENSHETLEELHMSSNHIHSFPFHELPFFTSLTHLNMHSNQLVEFPTLESETLTNVHFGDNMLSEIPVDGFHGLPQIKVIIHYGNDVHTLHAGTFAGHAHLYYVDLGSNLLTHLPEGVIEFESISKGFVLFRHCQINTVDVNAITGLNGGYIDLKHNALTDLAEAVFQPDMAEGATLWLSNNPLTCGCDIAWLVTNSDFMANIDFPSATCYNGVHLSDIDPDTAFVDC